MTIYFPLVQFRGSAPPLPGNITGIVGLEAHLDGERARVAVHDDDAVLLLHGVPFVETELSAAPAGRKSES